MSGFNVVRSENGQVRLTLNNVKDFNVDGVAKVTGSATFSLGNTGQESNETVLQMGATQDTPTVLQIDDDLDNIEFYGSDLNAKFANTTGKEYNIQWSAKNSTLNATKDEGSFIINTHEKSENNTFNLGDAVATQSVGGLDVHHVVVDSGTNNTFFAASKTSSYLQTTETSDGAKFYAGNGNNTFHVNGKNGFVVGGSGRDGFITADKAEKNLLAGMAGNDAFVDFGKSNLILGGAGDDAINVNGEGGLANLGFGDNYKANVGVGASDNAVFAGKEYVASDLTRYNYVDYLNNYLETNGITMEEFEAKAGLSKNASVNEIIDALKGEL